MDRSVINVSSGIQLCLDQLSNKAKSQFPLPQVQLSASVNRSRSPGRSPLPTLAGPTFSDEPAHHSVHHISFLWALCQEFVRSTTHRKPAPSATFLPFWEISPNRQRTASF